MLVSRPLLSIVGPTATGKTDRAFTEAEKILRDGKFTGVDIISVDSRQVYQGLEIISGADIPEKFSERVTENITIDGQPTRFFTHGQITLYGISIIKPDQLWSMADFQTYTLQVLEQSWDQSRLPILVGGTGLYHYHLFNEKIGAKPGVNLELRSQLKKLSVPELQGRVQSLDAQLGSDVFNQLNQSDRANPRRLIRAIEVATSGARKAGTGEKNGKKNSVTTITPTTHQTLFLSVNLTVLEDRIRKRVAKRFAGGAVGEVEKLLQFFDSGCPAASATGVPELSAYLRGELTAKECQALWTLREFQYAKRQLTWWKKYLPKK